MHIVNNINWNIDPEMINIFGISITRRFAFQIFLIIFSLLCNFGVELLMSNAARQR